MKNKMKNQAYIQQSNWVMKLLWISVLVIVCVVMFIFFITPKPKNLKESDIFSDAIVKKEAYKVIDELDEMNVDALCENATLELQEAFRTDALQDAKQNITSDFGKRKTISKYYANEVTQKNVHMAIVQLYAEYENVNVIYTLTFDENMKLCGLYLK